VCGICVREKNSTVKGVTIDRFLKGFERYIIVALIGMMMVLILAATVELGWLILRDFRTGEGPLLTIDELLDIFGFFLLILDLKELPVLTILGIAAIIIALAVAYYLEKQTRTRLPRGRGHAQQAEEGEAAA